MAFISNNTNMTGLNTIPSEYRPCIVGRNAAIKSQMQIQINTWIKEKDVSLKKIECKQVKTYKTLVQNHLKKKQNKNQLKSETHEEIDGKNLHEIHRISEKENEMDKIGDVSFTEVIDLKKTDHDECNKLTVCPEDEFGKKNEIIRFNKHGENVRDFDREEKNVLENKINMKIDVRSTVSDYREIPNFKDHLSDLEDEVNANAILNDPHFVSISRKKKSHDNEKYTSLHLLAKKRESACLSHNKKSVKNRFYLPTIKENAEKEKLPEQNKNSFEDICEIKKKKIYKKCSEKKANVKLKSERITEISNENHENHDESSICNYVKNEQGHIMCEYYRKQTFPMPGRNGERVKRKLLESLENAAKLEKEKVSSFMTDINTMISNQTKKSEDYGNLRLEEKEVDNKRNNNFSLSKHARVFTQDIVPGDDPNSFQALRECRYIRLPPIE